MNHARQNRFIIQPRCWHRGFTLIEMMVVLLIVGLMMVVLFVNLHRLLGKRGLNMVASTVGGYFETIRGEAVNHGEDLLIVIIPEGKATFTVAAGNSQRSLQVGPGIYPFVIDRLGQRNARPWDRLLYLGHDLVFEDKFSDIAIHPEKLKQWKSMEYPLFPGVLRQDLEAIGIPKGAMLYYLQSDGRVIVPGDIPGFIVDHGAIDKLDGDLIFRDRNAVAFLDVSPLLGVRATDAIDIERLAATPWRVSDGS